MWKLWSCRCTCGVTVLNIGKGRNRCGGRNQRRCCGFHATAVRKDAGTTSTTRERSRSRTSERCKRITRGSTASSRSCAANATRRSRFAAIGGRTRRTVGSYGFAYVGPISSTRDRSRTTFARSGTDMLPTASILARTRREMLPMTMQTRICRLGLNDIVLPTLRYLSSFRTSWSTLLHPPTGRPTDRQAIDK